MASDHLQEELFNIGIGCCSSRDQTTLGSLHEVERTSEGKKSALTLKPRRITTARLAGKIKLPSFGKNRHKNVDEINGDRRRRDDSVGCVSPTQVHCVPSAQLQCADDFFTRGASALDDRELVPMPSLLDVSGGDIKCHHSDGTATTAAATAFSESPSLEDSLAREVGLNAHEYLEECFYTEVSVLNRDKFDAVPEVDKSNFVIKEHLGRGSFSDVFDVVCVGGHLFDARENDAVASGDVQAPGRRRPSRGRRSTLSNSIPVATPGRPHSVYAMKCLRPQIRSDAEQFTIGAEDLVHETAVLSNLDHHHIIKLHGRASGHLTDAFVLNDGYFILLDRLNMTLHDHFASWKKIKGIRQSPTVKQLEVAHSVADAMSYLHSKKIVFRDLKPDNVGFNSEGVLKLFDFGFAAGLPEKDEDNPAGFLYDRCGTPRYMAPEVGLSLGYGTKADVYSFGILLWETCALAKPFADISSSAEFEMSVFMGGERPGVDERWPAHVKELMNDCWSTTPGKRPTMLDVKSSLSLAIFNVPDEDRTPAKTLRSRHNRMRSG
mmetsp:Transcript_17522/g.37873  ORF Transcript_17522/g.37873 Transcript_17522/m.37873 type:complete len:549 (-) Transcript_17522:135-1781(-)